MTKSNMRRDRIGTSAKGRVTVAPADGAHNGRAARALAAADRRFAALIAAAGPCRLAVEEIRTPFAALLESIVYQQLTGRAAATIHARVEALFPRRRPTPPLVLAMPEDRLRAAGLSRAKVAALKDLAAKTAGGVVPGLAALRRMPEEEIVARLTQVRGVGRWTVEMLLIFRLGRPDVLPATDYGVRKGFARLFGGRLPAPAALLRRGERWRPYRTVAAWYLWRAADPRLAITPRASRGKGRDPGGHPGARRSAPAGAAGRRAS